VRPYTLSKKLLANLVYVVILFNLQLPVFKDRVRTPSGANEGIVYHLSPATRKGGNDFSAYFRLYLPELCRLCIYLAVSIRANCRNYALKPPQFCGFGFSTLVISVGHGLTRSADNRLDSAWRPCRPDRSRRTFRLQLKTGMPRQSSLFVSGSASPSPRL